MPHAKKVWADPNREGKNPKRQGQRYCARCGNTVQQARILKSMNLCEFCVKELEARRDGVHSCRSCGQLTAADELRENQGYCKQCVCPACGRPDPQQVRKTGLCYQCSQTVGDFCRVCGKEAAAQVRKNRGLCDDCARKKTAPATAKTKRQSFGTTSDNATKTSGQGRSRRQLFGKVRGSKAAMDSTEGKKPRQALWEAGDSKSAKVTTGGKPKRQTDWKTSDRKPVTTGGKAKNQAFGKASAGKAVTAGGNSRRQSLGMVGQDKTVAINRKSKSGRRPPGKSIGLQRKNGV